jgi:uncharacterized protein YidB (DUF937 family)
MEFIGKIFGGGSDKGNSQTALMQGVMSMVSSGGGLQGMLGKFDAAGLGTIARSWVSKDEPNQPINGDDVLQALGEQHVTQLAENAGVSPDEASNQLATILPDTVDNLTPDGMIPDQTQLQDQIKSYTDRFAAQGQQEHGTGPDSKPCSLFLTPPR